MIQTSTQVLAVPPSDNDRVEASSTLRTELLGVSSIALGEVYSRRFGQKRIERSCSASTNLIVLLSVTPLIDCLEIDAV